MADAQTSNKQTLEELRSRLALIERKGALGRQDAVALGVETIDAALGQGLARGALHEVFAAEVGDAPAACAVMLAFALKAAGQKPILWVRQDFCRLEMGEIYPPGLVELGLDPSRLILVRARDGPAALRAAEEAARCSALGSVMIEVWGAFKALDLLATRRLALAAEASGLPLFMMRAGAAPAPSAAATRWRAASAPSIWLEADAPGHPAFVIDLERCRAGPAGLRWTVDWNRDRRAFHLRAPDRSSLSGGQSLSGSMAAVSVGGPDSAGAADGARRAGAFS